MHSVNILDVEDEVQKTFKPKWVDDKLVTPYIKKDGTLSGKFNAAGFVALPQA